MFNTFTTNKRKSGRPVSISKHTITKKCLDFYLLNGIDNQSFNNVIKYTGISKGSIYRLYGNEDSLQKSALVEYYKTVITKKLKEFNSKDATLKNIIIDITSGLISNRYKPCLYHRSRVVKYKLGKEVKKAIFKIDGEVKNTYKVLVKKELYKKNKKISSDEINKLVNFILNSITTINLMKLNNSSHKSILNFANTLKAIIKDI
ncbi:MAG: TetR/AcrR family transcriptional regulator [Alphaproteobacteria bacterium TMED93]|nr:MAG: TetR/AcrR family transcriptional regulator [Alphaproteobacteria bacterium TMED93]